MCQALFKMKSEPLLIQPGPTGVHPSGIERTALSHWIHSPTKTHNLLPASKDRLHLTKHSKAMPGLGALFRFTLRIAPGACARWVSDRLR